MLEQLEYIKKWCLQDQSALSSRDVADAVVRMIDDLSLTRAAELHVQSDSRLDECENCGRKTDSIMQGRGGKLICECCLSQEESEEDEISTDGDGD